MPLVRSEEALDGSYSIANVWFPEAPLLKMVYLTKLGSSEIHMDLRNSEFLCKCDIYLCSPRPSCQVKLLVNSAC